MTSNLENFSQETNEFKEISWVTAQVEAELTSLKTEIQQEQVAPTETEETQNSFYTKENGKINYHMYTVKKLFRAYQR